MPIWIKMILFVWVLVFLWTLYARAWADRHSIEYLRMRVNNKYPIWFLAYGFSFAACFLSIIPVAFWFIFLR